MSIDSSEPNQVSTPAADESNSSPQQASVPSNLDPATSQKTNANWLSLLKSRIFLLAAAGIAVLVIVLGLIAYNQFYSKSIQPTGEVTTQLPQAILTVAEPVNDQATIEGFVTIRGKTNPNSLVIAYTDSTEETFESDSAGDFSGTIDLEEGPNEITVVAFGVENEETSETRSVVYVREEEL